MIFTIFIIFCCIFVKNTIYNYKIILIGWGAGCLLALYFAQIYKSKCLHVILLDSAVWTPKNMKLRLEEILQYILLT
jgi:pimeloyl-ACP methyl ester carboxylesterase